MHFRLLIVAPQRRPHFLGSFLSIGIGEVSVNIRSHANRRMTQHLTYDLNLHALSEHQTCRGVTKFVEVRGFEPRTPCMPCKCSTS